MHYTLTTSTGTTSGDVFYIDRSKITYNPFSNHEWVFPNHTREREEVLEKCHLCFAPKVGEKTDKYREYDEDKEEHVWETETVTEFACGTVVTVDSDPDSYPEVVVGAGCVKFAERIPEESTDVV